MPRAGSTLLMNILAQNPRFHTTGTSGVMDLMFGTQNQWDNLIEFRAAPNDSAKLRVLRGMLENYYSDTTKPVVFDKCRGWLAYLEIAETILERKAKVLVPVRDIRDILASFEKLYRQESKTHTIMSGHPNYFKRQTVEGRTEILMNESMPVGLAYNRVKDAIARGFRDRMYFVHFEKLTSEPEAELKRIYEFLGEKPFKHDFDNVKQVTWEDDTVHGIKGLHDIRGKVEPMESQWQRVLGDFAEPLGKLNFWSNM